MTTEKSYEQRIEEFKKAIISLPDDIGPEDIEKTAARLERLNYAPSVITPNRLFLRLDRQGLLDEVDRILAMPEQEACELADGDSQKCEDLRLQFIKVILYYYEKLLLLRQGNPEEWDEIDELYVHD